MSFKPGMHQPVENPLDFNAIASKVGKVQPQFALPTYGWGKKCFVQAQANNNVQNLSIVVEFFTEAIFNPVPEDPKIGYTASDVIQFKGVSIMDVDSEPMNDGSGYYQSSGKVLPYDEFVEKYITDSQAKVQLDRAMEAMEEHTAVSEKMLENINFAWENREPGNNELYEIKYN